jgi:CheY-like chemotaxis protein
VHTVLLVEDEEDLREMMRDALELNGYSVVAVEGGRAALDAFDRIDEVCLVVLDLIMPEMDGWEFFTRMRARPDLNEIPVIVHSSATNHAPAGATRVLRKPLQLEQLLSTVREFCDTSS